MALPTFRHFCMRVLSEPRLLALNASTGRIIEQTRTTRRHGRYESREREGRNEQMSGGRPGIRNISLVLRTYGIEGGLERCTIKFFKLDFFATKEHERGKSLVVASRHNWSFVSSNQHDAASTLNNFIFIAFYEHNVVRQSV